ncbi:alpha-glucosidase [Parvularcula sp. ZS-1/3]|uniref:Alpha-glucosidase n=1 Tax=Parvularcula mediterranea TaxID=2732508 RepID=A0A7Y3W480_9PROT|nr:alpha-amylase family glycosyl hydrolase [Parvularcula mediterranea]NNU14931.1 alpha-glucosidase [Parvularcula mediterranea]
MADDGWWRGAVIYQIYPRSFQDTDGDGIGDLRGICRRLDAVADLGVDAIWLSPFYPSPMEDFGYDVTDHMTVDPSYGSDKDFDELVRRAHALGLKVIIDAVLNHTSDQHEWFEESRQSKDNPKADWYIWADPKPDGTPPNNWISRYGESQWTWEPRRRQFYRHQYLKSQPALNLANDEVLEARLRFMRHWLDRGVDGIRFDAVCQYFADPQLKDNPPADPGDDEVSPVGGFSNFAWQKHENDCNDARIEGFLEKLIEEIRCAGCTFTYAELDIRYKAYDSLRRYTEDGLLSAAYTPDVMEAELKPTAIAEVLRKAEEARCTENHVWCASNHDSARLVTRWADREEHREAIAKLAAALVMTMPGPVSFFQGEELGLPDAGYTPEEYKDPQGIRFAPEGRSRDNIRHPYPWSDGEGAGFTEGPSWLPLKESVTTLHREGQEADEDSVLATWKRMISLRQSKNALKRGSCEIIRADDDEGLLIYRRADEDMTIEVALQTKEDASRLPDTEGKTLAEREGPFGYRITKLG